MKLVDNRKGDRSSYFITPPREARGSRRIASAGRSGTGTRGMKNNKTRYSIAEPA